MEFKPFPSITHLAKLEMVITQKIHGSNAQITIGEDWKIRAGSRNRWVTVGDDNYGFAAWVEANRTELTNYFGVGTHYGEWAGPGINSGEGLKEKTFVSFDWWRENSLTMVDETGKNPAPLPKRVVLVPVLYKGLISLTAVGDTMTDLRLKGSRLVPGFMRPEGIVVQIGGQRYKHVFEEETTQWRDAHKAPRLPRDEVDYSYLLQPLRLEKLLSRDESYSRDYPESLTRIVADYIADLIKESQIAGDLDTVKAIGKGAARQIFPFIRTFMSGSRLWSADVLAPGPVDGSAGERSSPHPGLETSNVEEGETRLET